MKKRECGFSEKIEAGGTLFHMFIVDPLESNRQWYSIYGCTDEWSGRVCVENLGTKSWWRVGILSMAGLTDLATQTTFGALLLPASSTLQCARQNRIVHSTDCKTEQQKYSTFCKYQCACKCSLVKLSIYSVHSFNLKAQRLTQKCDVIYSVLCKTSMPPLKKWSVILL